MSDSDNALYIDLGGATSSTGVVNNITPSNLEKTEVIVSHGNANEEKPKAIRKSNRKGVNANSRSKEREAAQQLIGLHVRKEYNGAKVLGTVISYYSTIKLFEVQFEDNRLEYLEENEVLGNMVNNEDIHGVQQVPLPSNSSKKTTESKMKKATSGEASTLERKTRNSSRKKGEGSYVALALMASTC